MQALYLTMSVRPDAVVFLGLILMISTIQERQRVLTNSGSCPCCITPGNS